MTFASTPRFVLAFAVLAFAACVPGNSPPKVAPRGTLQPGETEGARPEDAPFGVVFAGPQGETSADVEVSVAFNRPLRPLMAGAKDPAPPVTMTPKVPGVWEWIGTRALRFSPESPLPRATSFAVTIPGTTRAMDGSTLGKPYELAFSTERPALLESVPREGATDLKPDSSIELRFNQPITEAEAMRALRVTARAKQIDVGLRRPDPKDATRVLLTPRAPLPTDADIVVSVDGSLRGAEGDLPTGRNRDIKLRTYGRFAVTSIGCGGRPGADCDPQSRIQIALSTPAKVGELRKAVTLEPAAKIRWPSWQRAEETTTYLEIEADFRPGQSYTVGLHGVGRLKDEHGQALVADGRARVTFGDLPPRVQVGLSGTYLEPSMVREIPLFATNVARAEVTLAPVSLESVLALAAGGRGFGSPTEEMVKALPGAHTKTVELPAGKNRLARASLRLDEVLGKDGRGPVAVAVSFPARSSSDVTAEIVQVTDLGVSAKLSTADASVVWVTRLSTGAPVEGAAVQILASGAMGPPALVHTDAQGIARLPQGSVPAESAVRQTAVVAVRLGDDWTYRAVNATEDLWRFGATSSCEDDCDRAVGLLFTERGLYRPGEEVQLKGIVRIPDGKGLRTPRGSRVKVFVEGPEREKIATTEETLTTFGTFAPKVKLPATGKVGQYRVTAELPGAGGSVMRFASSFQVAEYRPAEFKVAVDAEKPSYVRGDTLRCKVRGDYLFGAPMAGAEARVAVTRTWGGFMPPGLEDFRIDDDAYGSAHADGSSRGGEVASAKGKLDDKGAFLEEAKLDMPGQRGPERVGCDAEVLDLSRQSLSSATSAIVHPGEFYVGLRAGEEYFVKAGSTIHPQVLAVEPGGKHRSGATVRLELYQRSWKIARQAGGGGYHTDVTVDDAGQGGCTVTTADKPVSCELRVATAGYYLVRATSADGRGNRVASSDGLYALSEGGGGSFGWGDGDQQKVELVANKKSYAPGDTARILVKSPFATAEALVTVEREGVISERRMTLSGPTPTITVPITDALLPNAYVSVLLVRGRSKAAPTSDAAVDVGAPTFRLGIVQLPVDIDSRKLRVAVKPRATDLHPGDMAEIDVEVKDAAKKGARAEVTLYAVDEGTLSLAGYRTPDPVAAFFAPRPLQVTTSDSRRDLARIQRGAHGLLAGLDKGLDGGGGGDGPRRDFRQTAFFQAALLTSDDGKAHASFKLPDSLSTFRVMAVVATAEDRFGAGEALITTSKPLMVRPALPRILRAGDTLEAAAIVTSKGLARSTVEISMAVEGLTATGPSKRSVELDPGQSLEVRFPVSAPQAGKVKIRFAASGGGATDAVEVLREVKSPMLLEAVALHGDTTSAQGEALGDLSAIRSDVGGLQLSMSATALTGLAGGVEQLVEYPYGCTEQLTSRLVPLLPLRDLARVYGLSLPKDLDQAVLATLSKVSANQHDDGGFGLWPESKESSAWLTAYALWGLGDAQRRGLFVRPQVLENGTRYLRRELTRTKVDKHGRAEGAFIVDVLAENGDPDPGAMAELFEHREDMPAFAKAQLLHAMATSHAAPASIATLTREVEQSIRFDGAVAMATSDRSWDDMLDSSTRTAALVLRALVAAEPTHPLAGKLASGILAARRQGTWRTTQETAWSLLALDAYRRAQESTAPSFDARVFLGKAMLADVPFRDRSVLAVESELPTADILRAGGEVLAFQVKGEGHLFYQARLRFARKEMPKEPVERGFYLERASRVVTPETMGSALSQPMHGYLTKVSAGDLVLVNLTVVAPSERSFVVLDDALPAGLEAVDATLAHQGSYADLGSREASSEDEDEPGERHRWGYRVPLTRKETRDDRVLFFADDMPAGVHHYRYLARATSVGVFAAPPSRIEEMYVPETFGTTSGATLEVMSK